MLDLNVKNRDVRFKCKALNWPSPKFKKRVPYFVAWPKLHKQAKLSSVVKPLRGMEPIGAVRHSNCMSSRLWSVGIRAVM